MYLYNYPLALYPFLFALFSSKASSPQASLRCAAKPSVRVFEGRLLRSVAQRRKTKTHLSAFVYLRSEREVTEAPPTPFS